jgi:hypothetical protein
LYTVTGSSADPPARKPLPVTAMGTPDAVRVMKLPWGPPERAVNVTTAPEEVAMTNLFVVVFALTLAAKLTADNVSVVPVRN